MKRSILSFILLFLLSSFSFAAEITTTYQGAFGMQLVGGTNHSSLFRADLYYNYNKKWDYEWTFDLRSDFQSVGTLESISKHMASIRYGKSIDQRWYYFKRFDLENDRLRNLDTRYGIGLGLGYWLIDSEDVKFLIELSVGTYSDHLLDASVEEYGVLQFRDEFIKKLSDSLYLNQELFITNLKDATRYILDISLENVLSEQWGILISSNYDLAVYDSDLQQEDIKFLVEVIFNLESSN